MDIQPLVIVGDPNANTLDIVESIYERNKIKPTYDIKGYINAKGDGDNFDGIKCLGAYDSARAFNGKLKLTCPIGNRVETVRTIGLPRDRYQTIIHPSAYISPYANLGRGCFIAAGCTVAAHVIIRDLAILLQQVALSHDDIISDYCTITTGAKFSGRVQLGESCYIGANATIVDGATVGPGCVIGAGALVRHDVPPRQVWVGNPARYLRDQTPDSKLGEYTRTEE